VREEGEGGSPTAVLPDGPYTDEERRDVPVRSGASHAVFVGSEDPASGAVGLRFFTSAGELPACGHGTVAALAWLADRSGRDELRVTLRLADRTLLGSAVRDGARFRAAFRADRVTVRQPAAAERYLAVTALGLAAADLAPGACVAALGRERLLLPVRTREALAALKPDLDALRRACDHFGLLGCYVHTVPTPEGRVAARMFAPSIGVPEDVANANSTACLAAHLATAQGRGQHLDVEMGDSLGHPATLVAEARSGPHGVTAEVGGWAQLG
jgi:PhzF family phenazine biosynthesis protein